MRADAGKIRIAAAAVKGKAMRDGFICVSAATPELAVADVAYNVDRISAQMREACEGGAKIVVFPELSITGYTCGDLFYQHSLIEEAKCGLLSLVEKSRDMDAVFFVGLPFLFLGKLYNVAAAFANGKLLGLVPKVNLPNYDEFYEKRQFTPGFCAVKETTVGAFTVPIGSRLLFVPDAMPDVAIACELCEDLWVPAPPSISHALNGANVIVNLSASNELIGKSDYRRELVATQSARLYAAYIYASAGTAESTQDVVYSGARLIAENGTLLAEGERFTDGIEYGQIDIEALSARRLKMNTYRLRPDTDYRTIPFSIKKTRTHLARRIDPTPFVPSDAAKLKERCEEIFTIQAMGLKKRLKHTASKTAVVGISGGLDSALALLVTVRAFDLLQIPRDGIIAVTMPGFGTTDRTYDNAVAMIDALMATKKEIPITAAVRQHFSDIGQDENVRDVTYENAQARERTQILMDIANQTNGMVVGTGDLSELALGWATYNGDHMSMYGVNASIPKTLVRHLVRYYADNLCGTSETLRDVLYDVLDTPVSPELLPPEDGKIAQKTEDLVGPYELHDFFLYYLLRFGYTPAKIFRLAKIAFEKKYDAKTILSWEKTFYRRFFTQQFKRSCLPDGPKVGTVALSPRGDWRMPSDASWNLWRTQLERIDPEEQDYCGNKSVPL